MRKTVIKVIKFTLRWGIAVGGIWWVLANTTLSDRILVLDGQNHPVSMELLREGEGEPPVYTVRDPATGQERQVPHDQTANRPDRKKLRIVEGGRSREVSLLGADLAHDEESRRAPEVRRLLVADSEKAPGRWIAPAEVEQGYRLQVPHPRIERGLTRMIRGARPGLLVLSIAIFPVTVLITSWRWRRLMRAVDIDVPLSKALALNMVGMFYNTFIPTGSTGGDVLKAYYAARHTPHKLRAVITVVVDRVVGLVVLIVLGGSIALGYYLLSSDRHDPAAQACGQVAAGSGVLLLTMAVGLFVIMHRGLRRALGMSYLLGRLPMQDKITKLHETLSMYRKRPGLILWAMAVTVPVHLTVMVAAMLAGKALHLPLTSGYYFVVVPVTVLAGSLPISPQGAGVMEFFAIRLTARQGATIAQAFALTLTIRAQQIFWNLVGGLFVLSGHYRAREADVAEEPSEA